MNSSSAAEAIGGMRQIDGYSDHMTKWQPQNHWIQREQMTGANDTINKMHTSSHAITNHFGNLANLSGYGIRGSLDAVSQHKPVPAEKIEPTWQDDDDD